jgi:hypothetical protein
MQHSISFQVGLNRRKTCLDDDTVPNKFSFYFNCPQFLSKRNEIAFINQDFQYSKLTIINYNCTAHIRMTACVSNNPSFLETSETFGIAAQVFPTIMRPQNSRLFRLPPSAYCCILLQAQWSMPMSLKHLLL